MNDTKFCLKLNQKKNDTLSALENLLAVDSDTLVFGYGYMYQSTIVASFVEKLVAWLQQSAKRTVEFYVGVIPNPTVDLSLAVARESAEVLDRLQKLLPPGLYESGVTDRISVTALVGFHCKFALAYKEIDADNFDPVAGIFGSTNLTSSALVGENRFELDLWIGSGSPLLNDFSAAVAEVLNEALESAEVPHVGERVHDTIFAAPAIAEAVDDALQQELYDRVNHHDRGLDENESAAQVESDKAQDICADLPDFLRQYTVGDLEKANAELKYWDDAFANDRSNNPNKYEAQRRDARRAVRRIEEDLKRRGLIAKTDAELLAEELDRLYPRAPSGKTVLHKGKMYRIKYFPVEQSRSRKTVKEWGHRWVLV